MNTFNNFDSFLAAAKSEAEAVATVKALNRKLLKMGYTARSLGLAGGASGATGKGKGKKKSPPKKDEHLDNEYDMFTVPDTVLRAVGDEALIYDAEEDGDDDDD